MVALSVAKMDELQLFRGDTVLLKVNFYRREYFVNTLQIFLISSFVLLIIYIYRVKRGKRAFVLFYQMKLFLMTKSA